MGAKDDARPREAWAVPGAMQMNFSNRLSNFTNVLPNVGGVVLGTPRSLSVGSAPILAIRASFEAPAEIKNICRSFWILLF